MKSFKQYLEEQQSQGTLHVADIDDTLFHTTAKVGVRDPAGKVIQRLSNSEFNDHKLPPNHSYDFGEFRDAQKFRDESKPIPSMISKINRIQANIKKHPNSRVIINTARDNFDNKDTFLDTFRNQGMDIDKIHVHRAGSIPGDELPADKKVKIIKNYLDKYNHKKVVMYDDSKTNLRALLNMKREYPNVQFTAFHVKPNGSMSKFTDEEK